MSTNDVPGANPANRDELAMGAWAEHADGSLIFVESTEGGTCIYEVFDLSERQHQPVGESIAQVGVKQAVLTGIVASPRGPFARIILVSHPHSSCSTVTLPLGAAPSEDGAGTAKRERILGARPPLSSSAHAAVAAGPRQN